VTVEHVVPVGGQDTGGTAWSRVVPKWFGGWCAKRDHVPHEQIDIARLSLGISYARPLAAARWLAEVFAFESANDLPEGPDPLPEGAHEDPWIEFRIGNSVLNRFKLDGEPTGRCAHTSPGCTSTTSRPIARTQGATARPSWRRSTPTLDRRSMSPMTWKGTAGPSLRPDPPCVEDNATASDPARDYLKCRSAPPDAAYRMS